MERGDNPTGLKSPGSRQADRRKPVVSLLARWVRQSPALRRSLWKGWYELLAGRHQQQDWKFMNFGYAPLTDGEAPLQLRPEDEPDRYSIQLYHHVAGRVDLGGAAVLEVGSGRGGGCAYLARYLGPASVLGVDFSRQAVQFCNRTYAIPGLSFCQGDAEALPCEDASFDAVVNVESSHCYGSMPAFLSEVLRVLKPGGHLLWADVRTVRRMQKTRQLFLESGFDLAEETVITPNVLRALDLAAEARRAMVTRLAPRFLAGPAGDFAAVPGSAVYEALHSGKQEYRSCVLRKPVIHQE